MIILVSPIAFQDFSYKHHVANHHAKYEGANISKFYHVFCPATVYRYTEVFLNSSDLPNELLKSWLFSSIHVCTNYVTTKSLEIVIIETICVSY